MNYRIHDITFGITCFERPKELRRLLLSIYKYFENPIVLVVSDSKYNKMELLLSKEFNEVKFIFTDYDVGASKKRNIIMNEVKTSLILLLEEDFIFVDSKGLESAINTMNNKKLDMIAGRVENVYEFDLTNFLVAMKKILFRFDFSRIQEILLQSKVPVNFYASYSSKNNELVTHWNKLPLNEINETRFDLYPNFFLIKKENLIRINGWQPEDLKDYREHVLFFVRLYEENLKSLFLYDFYILHKPKKRLFYLLKRLRKTDFEISDYIKYKNIEYSNKKN